MEDKWIPPRSSCSIPSGLGSKHLPYDSACEWVVEAGPVTKWRRDNGRGGKLACYHWAPAATCNGEHEVKAVVLAVHGYAGWTLFQNLKHARNGETKQRGLFFDGSFVERVTRDLGYHFYGMDMEGHGYSRPDEDPMPCFMSNGLEGVMADVKALLAEIRESLSLSDNSKVILIGHSTGSLVLTRVAQQLENNDKESGGCVGAMIHTSPLYGLGTSDASESVVSPGRGGVSMAMIRGILRLANALAPRKLLNGADGNPADEDKSSSNVLPEVVQRAIAPGNLIERWIAGDRERDPVFMAPFSPVYVNFVYSMFNEIARALRAAPRTTIPTLIVHSDFDPLLSPRSSARFVRLLGSGDKTLEAPEGYIMHNPQLEQECEEQVNTKICEWMRERFSLAQNQA